ncbi:MAG: ion transporter [Proteobacteria bacterium]|nr:ion transporter [Pseudomonadota bacterium]
MKRVVDFIIAEITVVTFILINTVALVGLSMYPITERYGTIWFAIDYGCVIYFIIEAALKIRRFSWSDYWESGWNRFDFIIVIISLPALLTPIIDLQAFSIILILRIGRLFRLFRLMRFIPNRVHLAAGISRALKASLGVFVALVLVNIMFSVGASLLFRDLAPEYFGSPMLSMYSFFKIFTVEGWYEIPDLLASRADSQAWAVFARVYFVLSVLIGGILGLSLANAVFVNCGVRPHHLSYR